jgi:hypothetical protein
MPSRDDMMRRAYRALTSDCARERRRVHVSAGVRVCAYAVHMEIIRSLYGFLWDDSGCQQVRLLMVFLNFEVPQCVPLGRLKTYLAALTIGNASSTYKRIGRSTPAKNALHLAEKVLDLQISFETSVLSMCSKVLGKHKQVWMSRSKSANVRPPPPDVMPCCCKC